LLDFALIEKHKYTEWVKCDKGKGKQSLYRPGKALRVPEG